MVRFWGVEIGDWLVHMTFSGLLERVVEASHVGFCVRFVLLGFDFWGFSDGVACISSHRLRDLQGMHLVGKPDRSGYTLSLADRV